MDLRNVSETGKQKIVNFSGKGSFIEEYLSPSLIST